MLWAMRSPWVGGVAVVELCVRNEVPGVGTWFVGWRWQERPVWNSGIFWQEVRMTWARALARGMES